jgi:hypothetical protein
VWNLLGPLLGAGGAIGLLTLLARIFLTLHRDAIASEREAKETWKQVAAERQKQIDILLGGRVREPTL